MKPLPVPPYQAVVVAPGFALGLRSTADEITGLDYLTPRPELAPQTLLAAEAVRQLRAWLADPTFEFALPLQPQGTPFQRRVRAVIASIPCGQVLTYGEVAAKIGSGPRAVGGACGANPYPVLIPCHRVVSASGLGGFGGVGGVGPETTPADFLLGVKRWLLAREGHAGY
jgi:methylated-DNA-[protein]-cysteine S-methyltransferase